MVRFIAQKKITKLETKLIFIMKHLNTNKTILFFCGANLFILQFILIRELSTLLFASEIVITIIYLSYFSGFSLGYFISNKISQKIIYYLFIINIFYFFLFPFSLKFLTTFLFIHHFKELTFFCIVGSCFLFGAPVYSIFLPRFIDDTKGSMSELYLVEILGGIAGIFIIGFLSFLPKIAFYLVHNLILIFIIYLLFKEKKFLITTVFILFVIYVFSFKYLDAATLKYKYKNINDFKNPEIIFTDYSPYNTIELIKENQDSYLFLNGLLTFGSKKLKKFNYFLSEIPNTIKPNSNILIVGSGSMSSVGYSSKFAKKITTCEIDKKVIYACKKYLSKYHKLSRKVPWQIFYDDGKHFLGKSKNLYDIIIVDIPIPVYIQTAFLYTEEFYKLARAHLKKNGIISVSLGGKFYTGHTLPCSITASLNNIFPLTYVIKTSIGIDFAIGINNNTTDWQVKKYEELLKKIFNDKNNKGKTKILNPKQIKGIIRNANSISLYNLSIVYDIGLKRVKKRYFK